ncbi:hypothetical protein CDAR_426221 [Caerostris darwini]|uniref:Uncharacterized protein n=1 Tax=Caerostris darwini TaxID=1538125 RepID=A0AAV4UA03_9ARAC|nr:hypothetical protein CDAR_426221 [Caerostris darwini]
MLVFSPFDAARESICMHSRVFIRTKMPDNPAELGLLGLFEEEEEGSFTQICPDLTQPGSRMGRNGNMYSKSEFLEMGTHNEMRGHLYFIIFV